MAVYRRHRSRWELEGAPLSIYVAGPISNGETYDEEAVHKNILKGIDTGYALMKKGHYPYIPHLDNELISRHPDISYEEIMKHDFFWLRRCDALFRIEGPSAGADREVYLAVELGKLIFHSLEEVWDA